MTGIREDGVMVPAWFVGNQLWVGRPDSWPVIPTQGESLAQAVRRSLSAAGVILDELAFDHVDEDHRLRQIMTEEDQGARWI
jgi:hypothetical protein